jgi:hypothetical protein
MLDRTAHRASASGHISPLRVVMADKVQTHVGACPGLVQDGVEEERMIISGTDSSGKAIEE